MDRWQYARRWLHETAGYDKAQRLIATEARVLRVDPMSNAAIAHAIATYQSETGKSPRRNPLPGEQYTGANTLQEGLIP